MGSLSVYMPFTSTCLMASNFALCGMHFWTGVYSRDFILEMLSMRYVNTFRRLLFRSTTFRFFCFCFCGISILFLLVLYHDTGYNMVLGMTGLLIISIFGGGDLISLLGPTPSVISLPYCIRSLCVNTFLLHASVYHRTSHNTEQNSNYRRRQGYKNTQNFFTEKNAQINGLQF